MKLETTEQDVSPCVDNSIFSTASDLPVSGQWVLRENQNGIDFSMYSMIMCTSIQREGCFVCSRIGVHEIAAYRTYYARLWWLFSLMYSWQWPGHVINMEESRDTLLRSSRYSMGKALTSGPHHRQGPGNGSWVPMHGVTHDQGPEVLFIVPSRLDSANCFQWNLMVTFNKI